MFTAERPSAHEVETGCPTSALCYAQAPDRSQPSPRVRRQALFRQSAGTLRLPSNRLSGPEEEPAQRNEDQVNQGVQVNQTNQRCKHNIPSHFLVLPVFSLGPHRNLAPRGAPFRTCLSHPKQEPTQRNKDQVDKRVEVDQTNQRSKHKIECCHRKPHFKGSLSILRHFHWSFPSRNDQGEHTDRPGRGPCQAAPIQTRPIRLYRLTQWAKFSYIAISMSTGSC
jgi:hypothetical protein